MLKKLLNNKESKETKTTKPKPPKYATVNIKSNFRDNSVDDAFWVYCKGCHKDVFKKEIEDNLHVCPKCNRHYSISARDRINTLVDSNTFVEFDEKIDFNNVLDFPDYKEKFDKYRYKTNEDEAVITGYGSIKDISYVICIMNSDFMMGSMGAIVGEKITRAIEYATNNKLPIMIVCASGGARMQEGIISLMQMAKTSQALERHSKCNLPYIALLTNPTTGGVTASFAMLGDVIIAEPNALIGFAGPRVIEQTINQKLPEGFQTSEFLLDRGFVDLIVGRDSMKDTLYRILSMHNTSKAGV